MICPHLTLSHQNGRGNRISLLPSPAFAGEGPTFHYQHSNAPFSHWPSSPPNRAKANFKLPTTTTANRTSTTPNAATCGTQPLPQNCHTIVEITRFLRVPSVSAMVTSRYDNMLIQIHLLKTPAAISGRTIRPST